MATILETDAAERACKEFRSRNRLADRSGERLPADEAYTESQQIQSSSPGIDGISRYFVANIPESTQESRGVSMKQSRDFVLPTSADLEDVAPYLRKSLNLDQSRGSNMSDRFSANDRASKAQVLAKKVSTN